MKRPNRKKLKLLFVARSYPPIYGGMENFCYGLYQGLRDSVEIKLIANKYNNRFLGMGIVFAYGFVYSIFFGWRYDIYYVNDVLTGFFVLPAKYLYSKKVVTSLYGLDINYIFNTTDKVSGRVMKWLYTKIFYFTKNRIDAFSAISSGTAELGRKVGIGKTCLIMPGTEILDYEATPELKLAKQKVVRGRYKLDDRKLLFFIGRWVERKGITWFVESIMPDISDKYVLVVASDGPERDNLEKAIISNALEDSVYLLGRIAADDRDDLYIAADCFIMPNLKIEGDWEGFGIVAIEASMHGTPVLAAEIEGVTSAVVNNNTGVFFESGNVEECKSKLEKVIDKEFDSREVSRYTKEEFSYKRMGEKYLEFFNDTLGRI